MAVTAVALPAPASQPATDAPPKQRRRFTLDWLDALKGIAILAVVFDHAFIVNDYLIWKHSYFAVSWFIFLAGVSNTVSARSRSFRPLHDAPSMWGRRLRAILGPYLWASILAYSLLHATHFSVLGLLEEVLLFHALPPLYFVALLIQLLIAFPLLYWALYRAGWLGRIAVLALTLLSGTVISQFVTFPWVLGAHYFLGASFLYLFVLGMVAAPFMASNRLLPVLCALAGLPVFIWAEHAVLDSGGALMTHPPSNVLVVYAVSLLAICFAIARVFPRTPPVRLLAYLGRHSLDIFLYHFLFLMPLFAFRYHAWTDRLPLIQGQLVLIALFIPLAVLASLLSARASGALWHTLESATRRPRRSLMERCARCFRRCLAMRQAAGEPLTCDAGRRRLRLRRR